MLSLTIYLSFVRLENTNRLRIVSTRDCHVGVWTWGGEATFDNCLKHDIFQCFTWPPPPSEQHINCDPLQVVIGVWEEGGGGNPINACVANNNHFGARRNRFAIKKNDPLCTSQKWFMLPTFIHLQSISALQLLPIKSIKSSLSSLRTTANQPFHWSRPGEGFY